MTNRGILIRTLSLGWVLFTAVGCSVAADRTATPPNSRISVTFVQPERFTDVKDSVTGSERGAADLLGDLDRYVQSAGDRIVPAGLRLAVRITNIDLAGEFEWWRGPQFDRVRIMREIYPPRIDLQFRLTDATGAVVKEGRRALRDPLYLTRASINDSDRLRYDKELLGDWLRQEFQATAQAR
jgi:hypothetical protein